MGVVLLALPVTALTLAALGKGRQAPAEPVVARVGVLAIAEDQRWTWTGPSVCRPGGEPVPVRRSAGGTTELRPVPLLTMTGLDAGVPAGLVAVGRDITCAARTVASSDGGATWTDVPSRPAEAVSVGPDGAWLVARGGQASTLERVTPGGTTTMVEVGCPAGLGLTHVSSVPGVVLALCEDSVGLRRTVAASTDGGASWEWIADQDSGSGLQGPGRAADLVMVDARRGWLLRAGRECPEGELRATDDGGRTWTSLPCPADSTPLGSVLATDFVSAQEGALLGLRGAEPVVAVTEDGGRTWRQVSPPPAS